MLSQAQIEQLMAALRAHNSRIVNCLVVEYLKYSDKIESDDILHYLEYTKDVSSAVEIIFGLSNRGFRSNRFSDQLMKFLRGVNWDADNDLKLAALLVLPKHISFNQDIKLILRQMFASGSAVIRDATLVAAQIYFGIAPEDVERGVGDGRLASSLSPDVLLWLGIGRSNGGDRVLN